MKYREACERWEQSRQQRAFLEALPGQCVGRWFTYFVNIEWLNLVGTDPGGLWFCKETLLRDHKKGRARPHPSPASTYLYRLCQDISPSARKSSQPVPVKFITKDAAAISMIPPCSKIWTGPRSRGHRAPCPITALGTRASESDARARKELKDYLVQPSHFTNGETETQWGHQAVELLWGSSHISLQDISVCVLAYKILVWRLENIVTSELPRGDLGGKLNSITSRKDWAI